MNQVDKKYYDTTFQGESVEDTDFPMLRARASEIVEEMTMYKVSVDNMDCLLLSCIERVKKAICAQIEYLDANGGFDLDNGADFQNMGLGKFNYSKVSSQNAGASQSIYAPRALRILAPTGLLYRGGVSGASNP